MTNVDEWTDFIYIGSQEEIQDSTVAMIVCPPENHGGLFGHVVWKGGNADRLPPDQIRLLLKKPWLRATNAPQDQIEGLRQNIRMRIPARLRPFYS